MVMAPGGNLGGGLGSLQPANLPWYPPTVFQSGTVFASGMVFNPDNTYDIGANGANRPRDLWLGRNAFIAGIMQAGSIQSVGNATISGTIQSGNIGVGGAPVAGTGILVANGVTGGITIQDPTKVAGFGATGMTLSGFRVTGANGAAIPGPPLRGTATDGPVTGFSAWWYLVMNGFAGGWVPIYN